MSPKEARGQRIKDLRNVKKISQAELATKLGVSRSQIAALEGGKVNPTPDIMTKIVNIFDVSYEFLIVGTKKGNPKGNLKGNLNEKNPSLIEDSEEPGNETEPEKSEESENLTDVESVEEEIDYSTMKPEEISRLVRVVERLRKRLDIQDALIDSLKEENKELQKEIEDQLDSQEDVGEIRQFNKLA